MFLHSYRICFCRTWSNTHGAFCSFVVPQKLFKDLSNEFCSDLWCQAFQRVWCDWSVWNEVKFSEVFYSEKGKKQCTHNREEKERVLNVDMTLVEKTPVGHFRWRTPKQLERSSSFITFYYHFTENNWADRDGINGSSSNWRRNGLQCSLVHLDLGVETRCCIRCYPSLATGCHYTDMLNSDVGE